MRWLAILLAGCLAALTGCALAQTAVHNVFNETVQYLDDEKLEKQAKKEAKSAYVEMCHRHPKPHCDEFADGFLDGYSDYLITGGTVGPPAVPPLKYRRSEYLTEDGHARIQEYFSGFKLGAETAAASGKRTFLTVPVLLSDKAEGPPVNARVVPAPERRMAEPGETLPPNPAETSTGLPTPTRRLVDGPLPLRGSDKPPVPLPALPTAAPPSEPPIDVRPLHTEQGEIRPLPESPSRVVRPLPERN